MRKFKVAICQVDVTRDKKYNLDHIREMIIESAKQAKIVILPEMFNCPYNAKTFSSSKIRIILPITSLMPGLYFFSKRCRALSWRDYKLFI